MTSDTPEKLVQAEAPLEELVSAPPIEIELEYPRDFLLFCVPSCDARTMHAAMRKKMKDWIYDCELDDYLKTLVFNTKLTINAVPNQELEEFYYFVEHSPLPPDLQERCFQAAMVVQFAAEGSDELSFFAPFWTALSAGLLYGGDLDAILVDPYHSRAYQASDGFWPHHELGVPLTHHFLSVTGFTDERTQKLTMRTTGMRRFMLPELEINEVNPAFGPDIAYFLRGLGQYIWSAIERILPAETTLRLDSSLDFSPAFCELNKAEAYNLQGALLPLSLAWSDTEAEDNQKYLVVEPSIEFESEDQWFHLIVQTLRETKYLLSPPTGSA